MAFSPYGLKLTKGSSRKWKSCYTAANNRTIRGYMRRVNQPSQFPANSASSITATFIRGHIRRTSEEIFSALEARFERIFDQIYSIKSNCYLVLGVESRTAYLRTVKGPRSYRWNQRREDTYRIETLQMKSITRRIDDREPNSGIPEIQRKRIHEPNKT